MIIGNWGTELEKRENNETRDGKRIADSDGHNSFHERNVIILKLN